MPVCPDFIHVNYNDDYVPPGCGKLRYENKKAAITAMNRIMGSHRRNRPDHLRTYPCPDCRGWHLSKK